MAVKIIKGDLLNCGADIICHQTNFFGMMGGGDARISRLRHCWW